MQAINETGRHSVSSGAVLVHGNAAMFSDNLTVDPSVDPSLDPSSDPNV